MSGERRVGTVDEHLSDWLSLTLIRPTDTTSKRPGIPQRGAPQRRSRVSEAFGRQMGSIFRELQVKSGGRR